MDCLFLPADCGTRLGADSQVYWLPGEGDGGWMSLASCAEQAPAAVTLVLPAEVCSAVAVNLPTGKARWISQALAYAVEELLAENVDDLHLTHGDALDDGRRRVIAVRRQLLADWLADLQAQGLTIVAIHVDADLLPRDGTQLMVIGARALLGGAQEARLAFDLQQWPHLAGQCPSPRHGHGTPDEAPPLLDDYQPVDDPYRFLAAGRAAALNLAQGDFAVKAAGSGLGRWKPALVVLALVLAVQLIFNLVQAWSLERQAERYAQSSRALYSELFPEDRRIVNLRAQFDEHIGQRAGGPSGFMRLLDEVALAMTEGVAVTVSQLDYNQARGDLALQVRASDFATLEQLRQRLGETAENVQLGSASRDGDAVSARVVVGGRG
ncbi:type II secretion system protein GspL [Pseudomonas stutzeri]|uniref:Type II secretion system protein L n=1 Tax=Stutzerimonas stutzeri TaxID=316 RepID=A0A2N8SVX1_STUST|nr:type II secretion system protein GspL [Stutzerimonas stutzeri]MCQ4251138.1 type II secretion system protein GspL [Stutzerimonas stutzeri]PNG06609.1 type II secretion system protein GspL [Stutzerimonas stutzeri]